MFKSNLFKSNGSSSSLGLASLIYARFYGLIFSSNFFINSFSSSSDSLNSTGSYSPGFNFYLT
jgi:hypothetical protein